MIARKFVPRNLTIKDSMYTIVEFAAHKIYNTSAFYIG